jgi:hypothetical protein
MPAAAQGVDVVHRTPPMKLSRSDSGQMPPHPSQRAAHQTERVAPPPALPMQAGAADTHLRAAGPAIAPVVVVFVNRGGMSAPACIRGHGQLLYSREVANRQATPGARRSSNGRVACGRRLRVRVPPPRADHGSVIGAEQSPPPVPDPAPERAPPPALPMQAGAADTHRSVAGANAAVHGTSCSRAERGAGSPGADARPPGATDPPRRAERSTRWP